MLGTGRDEAKGRKSRTGAKIPEQVRCPAAEGDSFKRTSPRLQASVPAKGPAQPASGFRPCAPEKAQKRAATQHNCNVNPDGLEEFYALSESGQI